MQVRTLEARAIEDLDAGNVRITDVCGDEPGEINNTISIPWLIGSVVIAIILARWSKGSLCAYIFWSLAWLYISILLTQTHRKFQRGPKVVCSTAVASLIGWFIGTCLVWKVRDHRVMFFD